jgi:hypothetical protein
LRIMLISKVRSTMSAFGLIGAFTFSVSESMRSSQDAAGMPDRSSAATGAVARLHRPAPRATWPRESRSLRAAWAAICRKVTPALLK